MKKQKTGTGKTLSRIAALGLAGAVLWGGSMPQVSAATLKDLFDEHYYADTYKDLKEVYGYDREALWNHYMQHGMTEGRPMNELFDVVKYKKLYADLSAAFEDNWDAYANHYLTVGAKEGRESGTDTEFNAFDYASRYVDLQEAFGDNVLALWKHWQTAGAEENREARSEEVLEAEREAEAEAEREAAEKEAAEKEEAAQKPDTSEGYTKRIELNNGSWGIEEYNAANELIKVTVYNKDGNMTMVIDDYKYKDGKLTESTAHILDGNAPSDVTYYVDEYAANGKQVKRTWYYQNGKIYQIDDHTYNPTLHHYYKYDENWVLTSIYAEKGSGRNKMPYNEIFFYPDGRDDHYTVYNNGELYSDTVYIYEGGKKVASETTFSDGTYGKGKYDDNENQVETINYYEDGRINYIFDHTTKPLTLSAYHYDENKILDKVEVKKGQGLNAPLLKETFYDVDGNVTYYTVYTYDNNGKLKTKESFNADGSARE